MWCCIRTLMVLGLKYGHYHYNALEEKGNAYKIAEDFMNRFIAKREQLYVESCLGMMCQNRKI